MLISEWGSKAEAGDPLRPVGRRANRLPLLSAAIVALGALPAPAQAALTAAGAIDPATKAPAFYQDANGLKLGLCHPGTVNCGPAVPGEDFYYMATSTFTAPNGGTASLILNMTLAPNASGDPASFNRVRVQLDGFPAGTWTITHPYGTDTVTTDGVRRGRTTIDIGCAVTAVGPCDFAAALGGRFGPFLTAAPTAPAPPAGFIGDAVVEVPITGSPTGNNFFRVEGPGLPPGGAQSNTFALMGKLFAGVVPAFSSSGDVAFADQLVGSASATKTVTVTSSGVPGAGSDLKISGVTVGGANAADYAIAGNTCAGATLPSGSTCSVGLTFAPGAAGTRAATLTLADNTAAATHTVALSGKGATPAPAAAPVTAPAPAPAVSAAPAPVVQAPPVARASDLAVTNLRVARRIRLGQARRRGITARFAAPAGAAVARVRLLKRGATKAITTKLVTLDAPGAQTIHVRSGRARAGEYTVEVAIGTSATALGRGVTTRLRLTR